MLKDAAAALTLFTRLPVWRLAKVEQRNYDRAVTFWPLAGWATGGVAAGAILGLSLILPALTAAAGALAMRLLLTGALHEDGLADFCDGFGGGYDKQRILAIMKDSHIGTYGVIALIIYFLLVSSLLASVPPALAAAAIFFADPFSKWLAGQLTNVLQYARPEGAKNHAAYSRMDFRRIAAMTVTGFIPSIPLLYISPLYASAVILPVAVFISLCLYMHRKIGGYTGDCCGATFLICETALLAGIVIVYNIAPCN